MANGMLIDPSKQIAALNAMGQQRPQTPNFKSPWEQMAFQAGGMLGGGVGNQMVVQPQIQKLQADFAKQQKAQQGLYQKALSNKDKISGFREAAQIAFQQGDTKTGNQMLKLQEDAQKQFDAKAHKDVGYGQWAAKFGLDVEKLGIDKDRADIARRASVDKDKRTTMQKWMDDRKELDKAVNDPRASPNDIKLAQVGIDYMERNLTDPKLVPTGNEFKQAGAFLKDIKITAADGTEIDFSNIAGNKAKIQQMSTILGGKAKQLMAGQKGLGWPDALQMAAEDYVNGIPKEPGMMESFLDSIGYKKFDKTEPILKSVDTAKHDQVRSFAKANNLELSEAVKILKDNKRI